MIASHGGCSLPCERPILPGPWRYVLRLIRAICRKSGTHACVNVFKETKFAFEGSPNPDEQNQSIYLTRDGNDPQITAICACKAQTYNMTVEAWGCIGLGQFITSLVGTAHITIVPMDMSHALFVCRSSVCTSEGQRLRAYIAKKYFARSEPGQSSLRPQATNVSPRALGHTQ